MDYPRRRNAMAIQQRAIRPPWRNHGVSVAEPSYEWWAPARPKPGDSQEQVRLRLASANALNQIPRDPRYYEPVKEANWTVNTSLNGHFIPEYDITGGDNINCVHQIEPFISRPASKARADFVSQRLSLGKRSSPLLSYNSLGWNRRHYEPVPDVTRVVTFKNAYDGPHECRPLRGGPHHAHSRGAAPRSARHVRARPSRPSRPMNARPPTWRVT